MLTVALKALIYETLKNKIPDASINFFPCLILKLSQLTYVFNKSGMPSLGIWAKLGIPTINAEGERDMSKEVTTTYLDFSCPNSLVYKPAS